ncbi:DUF6884 domain-containing protein [Aeoliella sp.]|uniref:DUF6884 domain-containing protein n=1 Tax=Aeoliella sp. TaxID=2795800 RepID=UPI003CCBA4A7
MSYAVLVSCTKEKRSQSAPAQDLYDKSDGFCKKRIISEWLTAGGRGSWFITSAKHGLLAPHEIIEPYDQKLPKATKPENKEWGERVAHDLLERVPDLHCVLMLAPEDYWANIEPHLSRLKIKVRRPLKGLSQGPTGHWLKEVVELISGEQMFRPRNNSQPEPAEFANVEAAKATAKQYYLRAKQNNVEKFLCYKEMGRALIYLKKKLKHGEFEAWVWAEFGFQRKQSKQYRDLYEGWHFLEQEELESLSNLENVVKLIKERSKPYNPEAEYPTMAAMLKCHREDYYYQLARTVDEAKWQREEQFFDGVFRDVCPWYDAPAMPINQLLLDSGAYSQVQASEKFSGGPEAYYHSTEYWDYLERYATFLHQWGDRVTAYANLDVIGNATLTRRNQRYLELQHGLRPVPVVHFGTNTNELRRYIDEGYEFIGLGRLVGNLNKPECQEWLEDCFKIAGDNIRLHGFGVMSAQTIWRHRWHSVDGTTWKLAAEKHKSVLIPQDGDYTCKESRHRVGGVKAGKELPLARQLAEEHQLPLGLIPDEDFDNEGYIPYGLTNCAAVRYIVNIRYYQKLQEELRRHDRQCQIYFAAACDWETSPDRFIPDANILVSFEEMGKAQPFRQFVRLINNRHRPPEAPSVGAA